MAKPVYHAYAVREFEKDGQKESCWTKVGVVFAHGDGRGFDIMLEAMPLSGRITVREPVEKDESKVQNAA